MAVELQGLAYLNHKKNDFYKVNMIEEPTLGRYMLLFACRAMLGHQPAY